MKKTHILIKHEILIKQRRDNIVNILVHVSYCNLFNSSSSYFFHGVSGYRICQKSRVRQTLYKDKRRRLNIVKRNKMALSTEEAHNGRMITFWCVITLSGLSLRTCTVCEQWQMCLDCAPFQSQNHLLSDNFHFKFISLFISLFLSRLLSEILSAAKQIKATFLYCYINTNTVLMSLCICHELSKWNRCGLFNITQSTPLTQWQYNVLMKLFFFFIFKLRTVNISEHKWMINC